MESDDVEGVVLLGDEVAQGEADVVDAFGIVGAVVGAKEVDFATRVFGVLFAHVLTDAKGIDGIHGVVVVNEGLYKG